MPVVSSTAFPLAGDALRLARSHLIDADIPTVSIIAPTGAVRLAGQTTITTQTPHNFQAGDYVDVEDVIDTSFNGTFQLTAVPTATTFTYAQLTLPNGTSGTGIVELIIQGDVFTDAVLMPFLNKAYRKVQYRLLDAGSKTTTVTVELLNIAAGTTRLDDVSLPQLPVDFFAPRRLWERISGQPYYQPMVPSDSIPSMPQQSYNRVWSWEDEGISLLGSLNVMDIKIRYFKSVLNELTDENSTILIRGGLDAVSDCTAYLAAQSRGAANAAALKALFEESIKELLNLQAHSRGYLPAKRKSYNRRIGTSFSNYGSTI